MPLKFIHEYLGNNICSVKGPNWANVNATQRKKLVCGERASKMVYLYSDCSQVSVFYWYTSVRFVLSRGPDHRECRSYRVFYVWPVRWLQISRFYISLIGSAGRQSKFFHFIFCTGLASDVSSDPLNDGILELNFMPCHSLVPPILSRCF